MISILLTAYENEEGSTTEYTTMTASIRGGFLTSCKSHCFLLIYYFFLINSEHIWFLFEKKIKSFIEYFPEKWFTYVFNKLPVVRNNIQ